VSIDALKYLKDLRLAPNGEPVDLREKAILWYLANAHNEDKRCAWPSMTTIAESNNVTRRTVQEILKECIRKGIVWRREVLRANGSTASNEWRFTALDGEPTAADSATEQRRRLKGEAMAAKVNAKRQPPSGACAESFAGACEENLTGPARDSSQGDAKSLAGACEENFAGLRESPRTPNYQLTLTSNTSEPSLKQRDRSNRSSPGTICGSEEAIYDEYPRKVGRQAALKAIERAIVRVSQQLAMSDSQAAKYLQEAVREFAQSPAGKRCEFTPYCATWMKQERWNDDKQEWYRERGSAEKPTNVDRNLEATKAAIRRIAGLDMHATNGTVSQLHRSDAFRPADGQVLENSLRDNAGQTIEGIPASSDRVSPVFPERRAIAGARKS
jgi:hypothetical protein